MENGYPYLLNLLIAADQLLNALLCGSCDETLSSRIYRMSYTKGGKWMVARRVVDMIFFSDIDSQGRKHCELSYLVEMNHGHTPKAMARSM